MLCYCPSCFRKIYGGERRITEMSDQAFQCPECMRIGSVVMGSELTDYGRRAREARWRDYENRKWQGIRERQAYEDACRRDAEAASFLNFGW
ncbi:MAG: hypothetical protein HDQ88_07405 [Clostridia bacterium]|nr:hypothetical protein [Clostridia bacterium]